MNPIAVTRTKNFLIIPDSSMALSPLKGCGARYRDGAWCLPPLVSSLESVKRLYGQQNLDIQIKDFSEQNGFITNNYINDDLYGHQRDAVRFLTSSPHKGSMLSLSPGLGKTAVTLLSLQKMDFHKVLIVCPLSLIPTWEYESNMWTGVKLHNVREQGTIGSYWSITNYDNLFSKHTRFDIPFDCIVCDESILLKNRKTKRYKLLSTLRKHTEYLWLLSGSPISRYADDLWAQFNLMCPTYFSSYWRFVKEYCYIEDTQWGTQVIGTKTNIDLPTEFRDLMFVRNHAQVMPNLPKPLFETIQCPLAPDQRKMYEDLKTEFIHELESGEKVQVSTILAQLTRLQQVVSNPVNLGSFIPYPSSKENTLLDLLKNKLIKLPCIIWVQYRESAVSLYNRIHNDKDIETTTALVLGDTDNREKTLNDFKTDNLGILIMSLGVGRFGLTLTNAQTMVYYDRTFDADGYLQSLARVNGRIGLDHPCSVIILHAPDTTDGLIAKNLNGKLDSISRVTNSEWVRLLGDPD